jgi:putative endopeptidase
MSKHGINIEKMDRSANPGVDLFRFANGHYVDTVVLPQGYPRWGTFMELAEENLNRIHEIMQKAALADPDTVSENERKIGDFYASGMDEAGIKRAGLWPLTRFLNEINDTDSPRKLADTIALLHAYGVPVFFAFGSQVSFSNAGQNIASFSQSGLGLLDRDYYFPKDPAAHERLTRYREHIQRMLELLGDPKPKQHAADILYIETRLAGFSMGKEELRDASKLNNPFSLAELKELFDGFELGRYHYILSAPKFSQANVMQPEFFRGFNKLLAQISFDMIRAYLRWKLVSSLAEYLPAEIENESFDFHGRYLSGLKEQMPRWKRVVGVVNGALSEALGQIYVAQFFPPEAKERVMSMVQNGMNVMRAAIENADWVSDSTRTNLLAKIDKTAFKIGYPEKFRDYDQLQIRREAYVYNVLRARVSDIYRDLEKIGKPVDRNEWYMPPQIVNAYADPQTMQVVFPAGILQPPFFDFEADDAANYGGIFTVIMHEFGHFFDDQGATFDADGNVRMIWEKEDFDRFMQKIELIRTQYSRFTIGKNNDIPLRGAYVCGEAAADLNGARLAYRALQIALEKSGRHVDENGFTDEQRFFIAFAQIWGGVALPEWEVVAASRSPHPPGRYRANGTVANMDEFAAAFSLPADAPIMLPPEERARVW